MLFCCEFIYFLEEITFEVPLFHRWAKIALCGCCMPLCECHAFLACVDLAYTIG